MAFPLFLVFDTKCLIKPHFFSIFKDIMPFLSGQVAKKGIINSGSLLIRVGNAIPVDL